MGKKWIGLEKPSAFVRTHMEFANYRSGIYMSVVVIALECWVIASLTHFLISTGREMPMSWLVEHYGSYALMLLCVCLMLSVCIRKLRGKRVNRIVSIVTPPVFATVCIAFGIFISYSDYFNGEQILVFLTMIVFVACLLVWRPIISFAVLVISFCTFFALINSGGGASFATKMNLFTFWIAVWMASFSAYQQRISDGENAADLRDANSHLQRLAVCDELTAIANFHYFAEHVPVILAMEKERLKDFSILFLDIENFKSYNEKHGFEKGNALLTDIAHRLEDVFPGELVARFSDDHFVVLTKRANVTEIVDEWDKKLHAEHPMSGLRLKCGAYHPNCPTCDPRQSCDYARYACALTKHKYDMNYKLYDEKMDDEFKRRSYIVNNIDMAVEEGYIKVYYQPVVWAESGNLCGVEALARWIDPKFGFLSPGLFVPVLEEYRQVHKLDICIMKNVCRDIRKLLDSGVPVVPASINFSRLDFELADICSELEQTVEQNQVPKELLHVEVTESALLDQDGLLKKAMQRLQAQDFQIWLDDFGSGYSSLNVLKDYNFDVMKIDMQFLENFGANEKTKEILKSIVDMADVLPMGTLTEGVETAEEAEFLRSIGCKRLQGYHFGKPMPLEAFLEEIREGRLVVSEEFITES